MSTDIDGVCENLKGCKLDDEKKISDEALFKQPPPKEDCPICYLRMPSFRTGSTYHSCCGKVICSGCCHAPVYDNQGNKVDNTKCAFCRAPYISSDKEVLKRIKKRVKASDVYGICSLGCHYSDGMYGLSRNNTKALELYHRAGELGFAGAYNNIGAAYLKGLGVEIDEKKAVHYYKGDEASRHNLGILEEIAGNKDRALKHYMIAVRDGHNNALKEIQSLYTSGHATKEDYTAALRSYQTYLGEIKSRQRDKAAAFDSNMYRYY